VEAVMVREGMVLRCGDTAVVFDGTEFRLAYERARLTLLGAQIEYKSLSASPYLNQPDSVRRERELHHAEDRFAAAVARHGTGSMPDDEFGVEEREHAATLAYLTARREDVVSHRSGLAIARELAERARRESEGAIVRAAFDGAVANCMITPGAPVTQGQALFTLVDLSEQFLEAEVLENDISEIRVGRPAQITVHAIDGPPVWGRVASINPVANPSTGTMRVSVRVIPGGGATVMFRPGMLASVRIAAAVDSGVVLIPFSALMYRDSRPVVFVMEQDRALWRFVRPGRTNGEDRGIVSGLSPGEQVIIEGQATLGHDARVRVME
jgi:RND family efflux transporter MFP subunit